MSDRAGAERRINPRIQNALPADITYVRESGEEIQCSGTLVDISVRGLGVRVNAGFQCSIPLNSRIPIQLKRIRDVLTLNGRVARVVQDQDDSWLIGVVFETVRYDVIGSLATHQSVRLAVSEVPAGLWIQ